jgi:outer membrane protein
LRLAEAREGMAAVEGERWGSVALGARTGRSRASGDSNVRGSTSATLQWTVPLFDRGQQDTRLRDAQGQIQQRSVGIDDAMRQVELQVWQQSQALQSEREGLRESRLVLESAELGLKVSSERYRLGVGNFSDVLTAQNSAANARFQVVEARANLRRAQLRLAAAVGRFVVPLGS